MAIYKAAKAPEVKQTGDRMYGVCKEWINVLESIKSTGSDPITSTQVCLSEASSQYALQDYYKKYMYDSNSPEFDPRKGGNPEKLAEVEEECLLYCENDRQAMCETMATNGFNPTMTFTPPLHKDILMNCVWMQGIIPKLVTNTPQIQVEREVLLLQDPTTGEEFDMFQEQWKISRTMRNVRPVRRIAVGFPERHNTNFLKSLFGVDNNPIYSQNPNGIVEHLDTNAHISGLIADVLMPDGQDYTCLVDPCAVDPTFPTNHSYLYVLTNAAEFDLPATITLGEAIAFVNSQVDITALDIEANFERKVANGSTFVENCIVPVRMICYPIIGDSNRTGFNHEADIDIATKDASTGAVTVATHQVLISGVFRDDRLDLMVNDPAVKGFMFTCQQDSATGSLPSPTGVWRRKTHMERIPDATHIQAQVSPEEMKDVAVLYNVNQITKHMGFFAKMLENDRDDRAKKFLDDSFERMPWRQQMSHVFNFIPEYQCVDDHIEWAKKAFLPDLDTWVTQMLNIYNDGNVIVNIVGRSDIIRKLTPTQYTWSTPSSVGPFQLDFVKTVQTSDSRTYQFISCDKMRDENNLILILTPKNSERFMYRIYDYQTYVSNELRSPANHYLPAITAFDRWAIFEYMPVQARIHMLNIMGHSQANFDDNMAQVGGYDKFVPRTHGLNDWSVINPTGSSSH